MSRARAEPAVVADPLPAEPDPRGLDTLYRLNSGWLRAALLRRLGPRLAANVDDLVQESFLRAARSPETGAVRSPRAFLAQIARRLVVDQVRREGVRKAAAVELGARSRAEAAAQEELVLLKQVILSMPERYRTVFLLARFEGLSQAQIAERLGITEKAVEWRMVQALAHCAQLLSR